MAAQVEQRIVEMVFDNQNFEQNARESIHTIDELNRSVESLGKENSGLVRMIDTVASIGNQFSVLEEVARGALMTIGSQAAIAGEELVKNLTVDQVGLGFSKYEEETRAVQTIMNATGRSIQDVYGQLEKLMWFTDETSYNFVDMTSNIGKFTSQGIKLEAATTAMQGIATWAAKSGQGANEASRAMYNLAQSLGTGAVKLQDWMSIENANMATAEFKQLVIDTAKELGTLSKASKTAAGNLVTVETFRENMTKDKWFTSDVLMAVLQKYGDYAEVVNKVVQETGVSASEAMAALEGMYEGVGESAFKAAQEAKTFTDVIEATTDAVSTQWLKTFRLIFGNYEEAKVMWTDLANGMNEVFAGGGYDRNDMLEEWGDMGGREDLIQGMANVLTGLANALDLVKEAWHDVFPAMDAERMFSLTERFREMTEMLTLTDYATENIHDAFQGLFSVLKLITGTVGKVISGLAPGVESLNELAGAFVGKAGDLGRYVTSLVDAWLASDELVSISEILGTALRVAGEAALDITGAFQNLFGAVGEKAIEIFSHLGNVFSSLGNVIGSFSISDAIVNFLNAIANFVQNGGLVATITGLLDGLAAAMRGTGNVASAFFEALNNASESVLMLNLITFLNFIKSFINGLKQSINPTLGIVDTFKNMMNSISSTISSFKQQADVKRLMAISAAIAILAVSLKLISTIDSEALVFATAAMGGLMAMLSKVSSSLANVGKTDASLMAMATSILILSSALKKLSDLDMESMLGGLIGVGALMGEVVAMTKLMDGLTITGGGNLLAISTGLMMLTVPLLVLSKLPLEAAAQGVIAVGVVLMELVAAVKLMSGAQATILAAGASFILIATALDLLTVSVAALGLLPLEMLAKGIGATTLSLYSIVGALAILNLLNPVNIIAGAAAVTLIATAMDLLMVPILALSLIPWQSLVASVAAITVSLYAMVGALAILAAVGPTTAIGAASIMLMAVAITALTPALIALSVVPWQGLVAGVLALAGALAVFLAAGAIATGILPGLLGLSAALLALGVAIAAPVAAVASLVAAFAALAVAVGSVFTMTGEQAQQAAENIKTIVAGLIEALGVGAGQILGIIVYILEGIIKALGDAVPSIVDIVVGAIVLLAQTLADNAETLVVAILVVLGVIRDHVPEFMDIIHDIIIEMADELVTIIIDALGTVVEAVIREIPALCKRIGTAIKDAIVGGAEGTGEELVNGISDGIESRQERAKRHARELGTGTVDALNDSVGVHSASDATTDTGIELGNGLINGMNDVAPSVGEAARKLGLFTLEKLNEGLGNGGGSGTSGDNFVKEAAKNILKNHEAEKAAETLGKNTSDSFEKGTKGTGTKSAKGISDELKKDKTIEEAAKEQAEKVASAFESEISRVDLSISRIGSKYDIANALLGPEDTKEKAAKQSEYKMAQLREELMEQAKEVHLRYDQYRQTMEQADELFYTQEQKEKAYTDYISALAELTQKGSEIAEWQYEQVGSRKEAEDKVFAELQNLAGLRAQLQKDEAAKHQQAVEKAYNDYLNAMESTQKEYYYQVWEDLNNMTPEEIYGPLLAKTPDISEIRKQIYTELGVNPNNPQEAWMDVSEIVKSAIAATQEGYTYALMESSKELMKEYSLMIGETAEDIVEQVDANKPVLEKAGEAMGEAMADGLEGTEDRIVLQASVVSYAAEQQVAMDAPAQWIEVGTEMCEGVIEGIRQGRSAVIAAAVEMATAAATAARNALGIASPSKVFMAMGRFLGLGLAEGLLNSAVDAERASQEMVEATLEPFHDLANQVNDILAYEMDPTIHPVIDMTGVTTGVHEIDKLMNETGRSYVSRISSVEQAKEYRNLLKAYPKTPEKATTTYNFTQNNYSPKALSDAEIYRNTQNELRWALRRGGI